MDAELKNLQIDRKKRRSQEPSKWATRWIVCGVLILLLLGGWRFAAEKINPAPVVEVQRVRSISAGSAPAGVILNATGLHCGRAPNRGSRQGDRQGQVDWRG